MTKNEAIQKMINIAIQELGYLEKANGNDLDSKKGNAGYNNYTKYWRDVYPEFQGQPWCAAFVSWDLMNAFGREKAKALLKHWPYTYCPTLGNLFTRNANPKVGDIVIFWNGSVFSHTGIVIDVQGDLFKTIEGNTSAGTTVVPNGGGVYQKQYYNSKLPGTKFCTLDWSIVSDIVDVAPPTAPEISDVETINYTVKKGDTLYEIAIKYGTTVDQIASLNGISNPSLINIGQVLKVPNKNAGQSGNGTVVDYTIQRGDTLSEIAERYGTTVEKIATINGISNPNVIDVGQVIKVPGKAPNETSYKFKGRVTARSGLMVRTWAGTEHPTIKTYPSIPCGEVVEVLASLQSSANETWYKVRIRERIIGFVHSAYVDRI